LSPSPARLPFSADLDARGLAALSSQLHRNHRPSLPATPAAPQPALQVENRRDQPYPQQRPRRQQRDMMAVGAIGLDEVTYLRCGCCCGACCGCGGPQPEQKQGCCGVAIPRVEARMPDRLLSPARPRRASSLLRCLSAASPPSSPTRRVSWPNALLDIHRRSKEDR